MTVVTDTPLARRVSGKPRVHVTRKLLPATESRMSELFDVSFNPDDTPMTGEEIAAAMRECDVLVPTVTDHIDANVIANGGDRIGLIANFGAGTDHIDLHAAQGSHIQRIDQCFIGKKIGSYD